ncbi:L,D-transpeptidase family protein [Yinghuangia soli]|uniref:L,D-transpeptidase family protein n=1 Tax=Yinghuangia soli TaxID=2908204 RepID=A0AA41Q9M0_9ACTN|nr:L,D-transpeptidase family protein [Yinghuangia soli]MCF2533771.1 L,D-transpeptidase family protein [Yinghuangia soli]
MAVVLLCCATLLTAAGCKKEESAGGSSVTPCPAPAAAKAAAPGSAAARTLPGLGQKTLASVPAAARQVLVVTGEGRDSACGAATLYELAADGWRPQGTWPTHNGFRGWTDDHREGDLRSPIGAFTLSDAGGRLADPGAKLPYDRSDLFRISGRGFADEPLEGSFDYVVAIDYNRRKGTSPLDPQRPLGREKGGGIWLHVDHGGPTHGCVSLRKDDMRTLLRALDPARKPVVVMGDAAALQR